MNDVEKLINHGLLKAYGIYLVGVLLWHVVTHQGWYVHIPVWRRKALDLSRPLLSVCCLKSIHKDIHWTRHSGNKTMKITRVPAFSNLPSPVRWGASMQVSLKQGRYSVLGHGWRKACWHRGRGVYGGRSFGGTRLWTLSLALPLISSNLSEC